jgi:hypothetical protein
MEKASMSTTRHLCGDDGHGGLVFDLVLGTDDPRPCN